MPPLLNHLSRSPSLSSIPDEDRQRYLLNPTFRRRNQQNEQWLFEHIKSAFVHTGSQIVGLALIGILYLNYRMLYPY